MSDQLLPASGGGGRVSTGRYGRADGSQRLARDILWYFFSGRLGFRYADIVRQRYLEYGRSAQVERWLSYFFGGASKSFQSVFVGAKFRDLIDGLGSRKVVVIGGFRQFLYCGVKRIAFFSDREFAYRLASAACQGKGQDEKVLVEIVNNMVAWLKRWRPAHVIVINDSLPLERAWIAAARSLGIRTICIAHGLFGRRAIDLADGKFADLMLVYDDDQQAVVESGNGGSGITRIFGYHSVVRCPARPLRAPSARKVCILGQPWGGYYEGMDEAYRQLVLSVDSILRKAGYFVAYKPHPSEGGRKPHWLPTTSEFAGDLARAFSTFDVFVSLSSTALLEATLNGRVAIQVWDQQFGTESYEELGYAWTIGSEELHRLPEFVSREPVVSDVRVFRSSKELAEAFLSLTQVE